MRTPADKAGNGLIYIVLVSYATCVGKTKQHYSYLLRKFNLQLKASAEEGQAWGEVHPCTEALVRDLEATLTDNGMVMFAELFFI